MRKHIKQQIQEIVDDLAHNAGDLDKFLENLGGEEAAEVLTQMQELVIQVGNTIEDSEGPKNEVIKKLEEACEVIYRISCSLEEGRTGRQESEELKKLFEDIGTDIEKKIPVRLEVLFLPYQVSMWDSLESVWMAAKEDVGADCYVVPIPYYDVGPDGLLGEKHYDGNRYPDYVPVVPYWKYSVEDRRPDIIFFHNPYDETNLVTRVPEQYYARNLKKSTDMLVYIPYFVSEEDGPAEHQCFTPGVLFADRVVVQQGRIYERYCRIYTEILRRNHLENTFVSAAEKFLSLGSPKFDKIWNTPHEMQDLPEGWRKTILKPNGSRKKIIFYNLSIGAFLQNPEQMLKKVDSVLAFFKARQENTVLLWRPHPLLVDTVNSMTPLLRDAYMQRIQNFKEEGWGIYDETPDPNLAMALSDGYYGDSSSLLTIYRETGKPIMVQDAEILD